MDSIVDTFYKQEEIMADKDEGVGNFPDVEQPLVVTEYDKGYVEGYNACCREVMAIPKNKRFDFENSSKEELEQFFDKIINDAELSNAYQYGVIDLQEFILDRLRLNENTNTNNKKYYDVDAFMEIINNAILCNATNEYNNGFNAGRLNEAVDNIFTDLIDAELKYKSALAGQTNINNTGALQAQSKYDGVGIHYDISPNLNQKISCDYAANKSGIDIIVDPPEKNTQDLSTPWYAPAGYNRGMINTDITQGKLIVDYNI